MNSGTHATAETLLETAICRTAIDTHRYVDRLSSYPTFIHKWTKKRQAYSAHELRLPKTVFLNGKTPEFRYPVIAVGGTRSPSVDAFRLVSGVIEQMAARYSTILSGAVPGVDLAAHLAALSNSNGTTYGVLANPARLGLRGHEWNSPLVEAAMIDRGGFISEYETAVEVDSPPFLERLLQRDRLISGLCDIFLVFECRADSATVDTAKRALLQGKTVVCVDSKIRTERQGIEQLVEEYRTPYLSVSRLSPAEIAQSISQIISEKSEAYS